MSEQTFLDFCTANQLERKAMREAAVDYVEQQTGIFDTDELYRLLITRVEDSASIDRALYQFEGYPDYADTAALIILVAAWNTATQRDGVKAALLAGKQTAEVVDDHQLSVAIIAGIYVLVTHGTANLKEIPYRDDQGVWHTLEAKEGIPVVDLLYYVRDLFEG